jgi:predicted dehydrogenase
MRIGFVGAGAIARLHVDALRGRDGVEIAAICDIDEARAAALAELTGAAVSTSWQTMLASAELDAVFVCTPPALHVEPAVAALERGLALYLEKPLARSLDDGRAIAAAWQRSSAVCAVGYQWRSLDVVAALREAIAGLVPGLLVSRSFGPTEPGRRDQVAGSWFVDPQRSGGILFELASHDIDLQCALAGPVASVLASSASGHLALAGAPATGLDDAIVLTLRFSSGALGSVVVAWTDAPDPPVYALDVLGTEFALRLELDPVYRLEGRARGEVVAASSSRGPREATLDRFLEAVCARDRVLVPCTPADAFETLATAVACEQSLRTGAATAVESLT